MAKLYEYKQIKIPKKIAKESENIMLLLGCCTLTSYVSMALTDYNKKVILENQDIVKTVHTKSQIPQSE